jgi:sugar/nucleoside kinase (ribokinase family)
VMLVTREGLAVLPAYPTTKVIDPTGAGDSFAGGMMGYLATQNDCGLQSLKRALAYGTICASFTIEDFSLRALEKITTADVSARLKEYTGMLSLA